MKYGYPFELHEIQTEDGYLLDAYRLKSKKTKPKTNTSPIMLVHGFMASSDCFLSMGRNSLALLLADEGYDVWLPNCRGNLYSRKHKTLNPDTDIAYWFFRFPYFTRKGFLTKHCIVVAGTKLGSTICRP